MTLHSPKVNKNEFAIVLQLGRARQIDGMYGCVIFFTDSHCEEEIPDHDPQS